MTNYQLSKLLIFLEYFGLAASLVGAIAIAFNQPPLLAIMPIAITLLLNLINRQKLAKLAQKNQAKALTEVQQQQALFSKLTEDLQSAILSLNLTNIPSISLPANASSEEISKQINALVIALEKMVDRQNQLEQVLKLMQTEIDASVKQFKQRPELSQIESLTSVIVDLQQFINQLPQWGNLQQKQLSELDQKVEIALTKLTTEIAKIPEIIQKEVQSQTHQNN